MDLKKREPSTIKIVDRILDRAGMSPSATITDVSGYTYRFYIHNIYAIASRDSTVMIHLMGGIVIRCVHSPVVEEIYKLKGWKGSNKKGKKDGTH